MKFISSLTFFLVITAVLNPKFVSAYNMQNLVKWSSLYSIMGVGVAFVIITGGIDLSVGSLLGLCAILFGKLWRDAGFSPLAAGGCTLVIGALAGGLTNSVAIWMLFHPYEPPRIWKSRTSRSAPSPRNGTMLPANILTKKSINCYG